MCAGSLECDSAKSALVDRKMARGPSFAAIAATCVGHSLAVGTSRARPVDYRSVGENERLGTSEIQADRWATVQGDLRLVLCLDRREPFSCDGPEHNVLHLALGWAVHQ
jgi:hypothetical protein